MIRTLFLCFLLGGCAGVQTPLDPAGLQSAQLLSLFGLMLWVCGVAYVLVLGFLGWSLWRARRRIAAETAPEVNPVHRGLSRGLWGWTAFVATGLLLLAIASFLTDWTLARAERRGAIEVSVTGHQWWWRIQYRDPASGQWIETANELHLPQDRTTLIRLGAADVIHSFWIPNVAGKMDVIPGRANQLALTPRRAGWFRGQCAEFCGPQHAHMALDVKVESPAEFTAWLAAQAKPAAAGGDPTALAVVTAGPCAACHMIRGTDAKGRVGPDLTHLASRRSLAAGTLPMSRGAVQGWVAQPRAIKPGTMMPPVPLSGPQADAVSRYLMALK